MTIPSLLPRATVAAASPVPALRPPARSPRPGALAEPADRLAFRLAWIAYVHAHPTRAPSADEIACRCLLLGRSLPRSFPPVRNAVKLANGRQPYDTAARILRDLRWALDGAADRFTVAGFALTPAQRTALGAAVRALDLAALQARAATGPSGASPDARPASDGAPAPAPGA